MRFELPQSQPTRIHPPPTAKQGRKSHKNATNERKPFPLESPGSASNQEDLLFLHSTLIHFRINHHKTPVVFIVQLDLKHNR